MQGTWMAHTRQATQDPPSVEISWRHTPDPGGGRWARDELAGEESRVVGSFADADHIRVGIFVDDVAACFVTSDASALPRSVNRIATMLA
mmetsp:Transcript_16644/g.42773  ORF Transcript_16644/g.42773 Transcript_16644/m.42773 type:complete len:90 (-) Transcript_16644:784-1053(-)